LDTRLSQEAASIGKIAGPPSATRSVVTGYPEMVEREQQLPGQVFIKPVELDALAGVAKASLVRSVA
jgi:hypothetical protein